MTIDPIKKAYAFIGSRGGFARAKKLSMKRRKEIARMGALATNAKRKKA